MSYTSGCYTVFHHRYHIVWVPKYRYKVLEGDIRLHVRETIRQVCREMRVKIIRGVLSKDHVHMFVEIPPHISVSDFVQRAKGRSVLKRHILSMDAIMLKTSQALMVIYSTLATS